MKKNQLLVTITIGALAMILSGCKTLDERAMEAKYTNPDGVTLMTEAEIRDALVGNTYAGDSINYPGSTYIEYVHADGKISGLWNGTDRYKGEWAISGKVWCYKYKTQNGCNTLSKSGDEIRWYSLDGTDRGGRSTLMSGDPKGLAN